MLIIPLIAGFVLDSLLGDPLWLPHPIRWFGNAISFFERKLNKGNRLRRSKGAFTVVTLVGATYFSLLGLLILSHYSLYVYYFLASVLVFYGLANRNLIDEGLKVERKLSREGLESGRKQVSFIVGRDTRQLSANQIRTAVLETLSENLSDGVVAPLFYYALGGLPLMFAYKMINTLDSMIAYKSERYKHFGFFAAKTDDLANYIPARITAGLMVLITFSLRGLRYIFKYGHKHASPNAGYPEAALAGILDCRFGGSNVYHGKRLDKPYIGSNERKITPKDLYKAAFINYFVALCALCIIILIYASVL
ncbi:MAG: cobalamin biosynthesis protein CobD [Bacteroidia bacterium]|nr:MAG: cobalamin biosynthesis protein CobD [Bacteroidia bacterium]PIE86513.1 MAG: cobalamin biosynthesis protein CobD [Bacteroidia bacterium]